MPTYQYRCVDCGHRFEAVQSFTDDALTSCPECGGQLRKVYGSVGVVFKGSGFYRTDSRAAGKSEGGTSDGGTSGGGKEAAAAKSGDSGKSDGSGPAGSSKSRRQAGGRHLGLRPRRRVGHVRRFVVRRLVLLALEGRRQLRHAYWIR